MSKFFGTDGIRGVVNEFLTFDIAYKCGNALARRGESVKILVGRDTRTTGDYLFSGFAGGALAAGAEITYIGICPTAGVSYLTKKLNMDYGVMISASHNPAEYNGIKIFNSNGVKIDDKDEEVLESSFDSLIYLNKKNKINYYDKHIETYCDYLVNCIDMRLDGLKIVIDSGNGAAYSIAPNVFTRLGAMIIPISCNNDGLNINRNCGALFPEVLSEAVLKYKADMGFSFDGDSDRIIACDENGNIIDGDMIIYILSKHLKSKNKLNKNIVIGTRHTNMGIEQNLRKEGIKLIRTDIGDKYVIAKMNELNASLGGEKSGHIIMFDHMSTGDGILTGVKIAEVIKASNCRLSTLVCRDLYPQINIDCFVKDKIKVINSQKVFDEIKKQEEILGVDSRIMVRYSGTEPKIRIMVESKDCEKATISAKKLQKIVYLVDNEFDNE